jgi:hypothetical protein
VNLIAIDPGKTTGWAVFCDGDLIRCGADKKADVISSPWWKRPNALLPKKVVFALLNQFLVFIETPRWYPHDQVDTNDLIDLAVFVGEVKSFYESQHCKVELVWPRTWKGNVPKEIMTARILSKLTPEELAVVPARPRAKTPDHNCIDAIGLGLWKLGRLR